MLKCKEHQLQSEKKHRESKPCVIICGLQCPFVELETVQQSTSFTQLEPEDATRAAPKAGDHERRRAHRDKSPGSGAMELGTVRLRKHNLLDEHRHSLFRSVARIRFARIEYHGSARQRDFIGLDSSIDPFVWRNLGRYTTP
jgi:hypothetical protein